MRRSPPPLAAALPAAAVALVLFCPGCREKGEIPADVAARLEQVDADGNLKPEAVPNEKKRGIVGRKTLEILDAPAVLAAGTHVIAQDAIDGSPPLGGQDLGNDPISVPLNALGGVTGFVGRLGMHQWVQTQYALEGRYPTYEEFTGFLEKNPRYAMPMPKLSQRYGYDETRGAMLLLDVVDWEAKDGGSLDVDGERVIPTND